MNMAISFSGVLYNMNNMNNIIKNDKNFYVVNQAEFKQAFEDDDMST